MEHAVKLLTKERYGPEDTLANDYKSL